MDVFSGILHLYGLNLVMLCLLNNKIHYTLCSHNQITRIFSNRAHNVIWPEEQLIIDETIPLSFEPQWLDKEDKSQK